MMCYTLWIHHGSVPFVSQDKFCVNDSGTPDYDLRTLLNEMTKLSEAENSKVNIAT
jgi:hypothetical protein